MPTSLLQEWMYAILKELNLHKGKAVLCFALVTCVVVTVGILWPKKFESAAIVFADDQNIIKPLLAGHAEVTRPNETDQLQVVQQRVFSDEIMKQVLLEAKLVDPAKIEDRYTFQPLTRYLRGSLKIELAGKNHIRFSFRDQDPSRAYTIASAVTNVFIRDTARSKREESGEAFKFIDAQVTTYKEQLQTAEDRLKDFKTKNPGSSDESTARRVGELRTSSESLLLDLQVARARRNELRQQIAHEKQYIAQSYKADVYRKAMAQAQSKLDTLRLSYQETYPDIVALKQQIEDLSHAAAQAESEPATADQDGTSGVNPVYQKLKSDLSEAEVNVKTLELKLESARHMLVSETETTKDNAEYQAQFAELTRDYTVTKKIYEDLLDRKEKARMSVALDVQGQGLNYRIQEPAAYPNAPIGLRFIHFFLAAPLMGLLLPIALIVAYIQLDPRVRFAERVQPLLPESAAVLIVVPHMRTQLERRMNRAEWSYLAVFVGLILLGYVIVAVVRLTGVV
jgi:polysaccharide chain length determinant protein (PEP-CTERM system associated)